MKIDKNNSVNFSNNSEKTNIEKKQQTDKTQKSAEASSLNALNSYGMAQVKMSFKGSTPSTQSELVEYRELTDEEFEEYKAKLDKKISQLPENIQTQIDKWKINRINIQLADKVLSDERLYGNNDFMWNAKMFVPNTNTPQKSQAYCRILDTILSSPDLLEDEYLLNIAGKLICYSYTPEIAEITNKVLSNENIFFNDNFIDDVNRSYQLLAIKTPEQAKAKCIIIDKMFSDENLYNNESFMNYAGEIYWNTKTPEQANAKCSVINKLLSDEELYNNEDVMKYAGNIVACVYEENQAELANKILSEPRLYNNENVMKNAKNIIYHANDSERVKLLDKIFSDEKLYNNENYMKFLGDILTSANTQESLYKKCKIIDKIFSDESLYNNKTVMSYARSIIVATNTEEQAKIADKILSDEELYNNETIMNYAQNIIEQTNNLEQAKISDKILSESQLYNNQKVMRNLIFLLKPVKTSAQAQFVNQILSTESLLNNERFLIESVYRTDRIKTHEQAQVANKILSYEQLLDNEYFINKAFGSWGIISKTENKEQADAKCLIIDKIFSDERLYKNENVMKDLYNSIYAINKIESAKAKCAVIDTILSHEALYSNKDFMEKTFDSFGLLYRIETPEQAQVANKILSFEKLYNSEDFAYNDLIILSHITTPEEAEAKCKIIDKILSYESLYSNKDFMRKVFNSFGLIDNIKTNEEADAKCKVIDTVFTHEALYSNKDFMEIVFDSFFGMLQNIKTVEQADTKCNVINTLFSDKNLYSNKNYMKFMNEIIVSANSTESIYAKRKIIDKIFSDEKLCSNNKVMNNLSSIIHSINTPEQLQFTEKILSEEKIYNCEGIMDYLSGIIEIVNTPDQAHNKCKIIDTVINDTELIPNQILLLLADINEQISIEKVLKLNKIMGTEKTSKLSLEDTFLACKFVDVYKKQNINEIPLYAKRDFLRNLVTINAVMFNMSDEIKQAFPLLPKNQEEYCSLLPSIVRSLGIETNTLNDSQVKEFNKDLTQLSSSISKLSDSEFNSLEISQEYSKDKFIQDAFDIVKEMPQAERQKVYDYFGFELHKNEQTGYSITGYPVNLNNGKKLAQITDPETKQIVEKLRPLVIRFSEDNPVICTNKEIEAEINKIIDILPELRPQIGKLQAGNIKPDGTKVGKGSHDFDVFKHSLKVMQKIVQTPAFNKLNESDKKLMLLASLLHDITKKEGYTDPTHANEGSFDTFYIAKKFNLSKNEEIKLYNIIKHHEWLNYVNTSRDERTLIKRLQDTAYDFRYDNLLDLELIFTHADLKAVKKDDSFHDKTDGKGRKDFNGVVRSYGNSADLYAKKIKKLIEELKISQPILPVTKIPSASTIEKAITIVNSDGSTNLKGIYKDKDGLVVIKYNEVENETWEKIGFPKGSISKGISSTTGAGETVDTGNIKFFAHGLDYSNQLINFDAFLMPDSDALLSVSYAERPESKYRFFRPQGILLDCETKYIHGGGETDSGSGCGKNIQEFKNNYIFGGERESDRLYVAKLIKETTGMNDEEYIQFVKENENKPLSEIEPEEIRIKLINAFATINSNTRRGNRAYNEMYISNPKPPMAVFAYNAENEKIENPLNFLNTTDDSDEIANVKGRTKFLRQYALERDIPFIVFCD